MSSLEEQLALAIQESLASFIDDDIQEYIQNILQDDPHDSYARENVEELIRGSIDEDEHNVDDVVSAFFECLSLGNDASGSNEEEKNHNNDADEPLKKLDKTITMKDSDITTYASGLSADVNTGDHEDECITSIASFYANMIDISESSAAVSERQRRKARQQQLREALEESERKRAIEEAMNVLKDEDAEIDGENPEELLNAADDNSADVHCRYFDLPNLRGGGPDLLQNASLTLARGRRYGLMGRNGCGKTTFMTFLSQRQIADAVPKKMSMLLVRQEIMGNNMSAVDTVVKSDAKREGVKRFIKWCEEEIDRLENGTERKTDPATGDDEEKEEIPDDGKDNGKKVSKGKQKLLEKKKARMEKAARKKAEASGRGAQKLKKTNVEYQKNKLAEKLGKAYEKMAEIEELEGGDPEPRARKVLKGMGFSEEMANKPTKELSGGWRMRVSISCALFANPNILLLDEPTNHLDVESCMWLERYLNTDYEGTLVVVSHDRHFLNAVVTDIVHFANSQLTTYKGDVTNYQAVRDDEKMRQIRLRENQEAKKAHLQKYIDLHSQAGENGPKAARQRKQKMKKLEKIGTMSQEGKRYKASYDGDAEEVEEYVEDETVELDFPDPGSFNGNIVTLDQTSFGYTADKLLLDKVDLTVNMKSRIALLGRNGCGKSTLIKIIVGALRSLEGDSRIDPRAKIEYLAQHQLEQLDPDGTPMQTMIDRYPGDRGNAHILKLRRHLASFGLGGEVLPGQQIHTMSGGQKCRLCLASAMFSLPHLLILDEPTNHLDFETSEALIDAIKTFKGGVLLVSHDQHLITQVCEELIVVDNGNLDRLEGSSSKAAFEKYKKDVISGKR